MLRELTKAGSPAFATRLAAGSMTAVRHLAARRIVSDPWAATGPAGASVPSEESPLSVAAGAVACSVLVGAVVVAFVILGRADTPGWSMDSHPPRHRHATPRAA